MLVQNLTIQAGEDTSLYDRGRESTVWGISLMAGYLGFDGFTCHFRTSYSRYIIWKYTIKYSTQLVVLEFTVYLAREKTMSDQSEAKGQRTRQAGKEIMLGGKSVW